MKLSLDLGLESSVVLGVSAAFSPASLFTASEKGGYWDVQDTTSMFQNSNGTTAAAVNSPVGYVADKSGNGNHLVQATGAARPTLRQAGAYYYLESDGVDDSISVSFPALFNDTLVMIAGRYVSGSNVFRLQATNGNASAAYWDASWVALLANGTSALVAPPTTNTDAVVGVTGNSATNNGTAHIGATDTALNTGGTGLGAFQQFTAGAHQPGANFSASRFFGGVVLGRLPTAPELAKTRTWTGARAGIIL